MTTALCPGTFDPFTFGHLDMVRQCLAFADNVVVGVAENVSKTPLFTPEKRQELAEKTLREADLDTLVNVEIIPGLLAKYCQKRGIDVIVKGVRSASDFDYESSMSQMNLHLGAPPTVFVAGRLGLAHISSSMVKEVARYGVDIFDMVNVETAAALYDVFRIKPPQARGKVIAARFDQNGK